MNLVGVLRSLAPLLQAGSGRIRIRKERHYGVGLSETLYVVYAGQEHRCGLLTPEKSSDFGNPFTLLHLEAALREECDSRGVAWRVSSHYAHGLDYQGMVYDADGEECIAEANTPAEALAMALLDALQTDTLMPFPQPRH